MNDEIGHALVRSLRKAGNEPQLTRAMVALAQADAVFSRGIMVALLKSTTAGSELTSEISSDSRVRCVGERPLFNERGKSVGRIDLIFESGNLALFVEVKLHSDYRPDQLADYLSGIRPDRGEYLIALTRNISRFIEPPAGSPGWLGSVRWAQLMPRLRKIPATETLRDQWVRLLNVLEDDGDMGSNRISRQLITAYERSDDAWERLADFLEQIGTLALPLLRGELRDGDRSHRPAATFAKARKRRTSRTEPVAANLDPDGPEVLYDDDQIYLGFEIPRGGPERLWIGFAIDDGSAIFYIAASTATDPPSPAQRTKWTKASESLRQTMRHKHFYSNDADDFWVQVDYRLSDYAKCPDVPSELATLVENDLPKFVAAGLFD